MPRVARRRSPTFFLGTHQPHWLGLLGVPMFVSRRRLHRRRTFPKASASWALDSGGFTELQMFGRWTITAEQYIKEVRKYSLLIGFLLWAAPQDWMCERQVIHGLVAARKHPKCKACGAPTKTVSLDLDERPIFACVDCGIETLGKRPSINVAAWKKWAKEVGPALEASLTEAERLGDNAVIVFHGTGLSIEEHQRRTIENFLELRRLAPEISWTPVLQGQTVDDYLRHVAMYQRAGIDLCAEKVVGVGSVCRRESTAEVEEIFRVLSDLGLNLHGFGVKIRGLRRIAKYVISSDSLAWSSAARNEGPLVECVGHKNCANCLRYALRWRDRVLRSMASA